MTDLTELTESVPDDLRIDPSRAELRQIIAQQGELRGELFNDEHGHPHWVWYPARTRNHGEIDFVMTNRLGWDPAEVHFVATAPGKPFQGDPIWAGRPMKSYPGFDLYTKDRGALDPVPELNEADTDEIEYSHAVKFWYHPGHGFVEWDSARYTGNPHHTDYLLDHPEDFPEGHVPERMLDQGWVRGLNEPSAISLESYNSESLRAAIRAVMPKYRPFRFYLDCRLNDLGGKELTGEYDAKQMTAFARTGVFPVQESVLIEKEEWRGPHENRELELMLANKKPVALPSRPVWSAFEPYVKSGRFVAKKILMGNNHSPDWAVAQPDRADLIDEIARIYDGVRAKDAMSPDDHRRLGLILGYDPAHVDAFIEYMRGQGFSESVEEINGVQFLFDPSPNEVFGMIQRSQRKLVRGLVDVHGKFIVWDAYAATHDDAFRALVEEDLIDAAQDPNRVFQIVINPTIIVAYQGGKFARPCNPQTIQSELFQMLVTRAVKQGVKLMGADPTRTNEAFHSAFHATGFRKEPTYTELYRNPSRTEFAKLIAATEWKHLRGLILANSDLIVWDAGAATHGDVIEQNPEIAQTHQGVWLLLYPDHVELNDINQYRGEGRGYPSLLPKKLALVQANRHLKRLYGDTFRIIGLDNENNRTRKLAESFGGYSGGAFWVTPDGSVEEVEEQDGDYDHVAHFDPDYRERLAPDHDDDPYADEIEEYRTEKKEEYIFRGWVRAEYMDSGELDLEGADAWLIQRAAKLLVGPTCKGLVIDMNGKSTSIPAVQIESYLKKRLRIGPLYRHVLESLNEAVEQIGGATVREDESLLYEAETDPLVQAAIDEFGTTQDYRECGFVVPFRGASPVMLDFSGKRGHNGYEKVMRDWGSPTPRAQVPEYRLKPNQKFDDLRGQRYADHREISDLLPEVDSLGTSTAAMLEFMRRTGSVRVIGEFGISLMPEVKRACLNKALNIVRAYGQRTIQVDVTVNGQDYSHEFSNRVGPDGVLRWIAGLVSGKISEAVGPDFVPAKFWYHRDHGVEVVYDMSGGYHDPHHTGYIIENPSLFGLNPDEIARYHGKIYDLRLMWEVLDRGWVRGSRHSGHLYLEGRAEREIHEAAVWAADHMDLREIRFDMNGQAFVVTQNDVRRYLRTGRLQPFLIEDTFLAELQSIANSKPLPEDELDESVIPLGITQSEIDRARNCLSIIREAVPQWDSPQFLSWFGDSVVRGANGQPLRVYHGTVENFPAFAISKWGRNETSALGVWFSDDVNVANEFSLKPDEGQGRTEYYYTDSKTGKEHHVAWYGDRGEWPKPPNGEQIYFRQNQISGAQTVPCYLRISNPKVYTSTPQRDAFEQMMDDRDEIAQPNYMGSSPAGGRFWHHRYATKSDRGEDSRKFVAHLRAQGHDGIILKGTVYDNDKKPSNQFVVFDPRQVKSAVGNSGAFNSTSNLTEGKVIPDHEDFRTQRGSTYQVHPDGTTTRTKAARPEHPGDSGLKSRSARTVYVDGEFAREIGMWNSSSARGKRILIRGDRIILISTNLSMGKPGKDPIINPNRFVDQPRPGLSPLELTHPQPDPYPGATGPMYAGNHPGNLIVESLNSTPNLTEAVRGGSVADETGEYFDNPETQARFPHAFHSRAELAAAIARAPRKRLRGIDLIELQNTDVMSVMHSINPIAMGAHYAKEYGKDWEAILDGVRSGNAPDPVVLAQGTDLYLLGGNTRLMAAIALKRPVYVRVVQLPGRTPNSGSELSSQEQLRLIQGQPENDEDLTESALTPMQDHRKKQFDLLENPTAQELLGYMRRVAPEVRIIVGQSDVWVWDARSRVHADVHYALELNDREVGNHYVDGMLSLTPEFPSDPNRWNVPRDIGPIYYEFDANTNRSFAQSNRHFTALWAGLERFGKSGLTESFGATAGVHSG